MNSSELTKLGLTKGEAKVYLALLKLGSSTVGPIVKESKIAYSNIYEVLERLIKKGLVSFIIKAKTKHFQAAEPYRLEEYLQNKEKEIIEQKNILSNLIPSLNSLASSKNKETHAEIFMGQKGLKTAYEKMVAKMPTKEEALFFYIYEKKYAEKADLFYKSIWDLTKHLKTRGLANKEYRQSWFIKKTKFKMKFVNFPMPGNIDIIQDHVLIVSWEPEIVGVLINSESIANHFRNYFNRVWEIAKE